MVTSPLVLRWPPGRLPRSTRCAASPTRCRERPMPELLVGLSAALRADALAAFAAVETAETPVPASASPALRAPALRHAVERMLAASGRTLVELDGGWLSGYDDRIADRLVADGLGALPPQDRAVLAL